MSLSWKEILGACSWDKDSPQVTSSPRTRHVDYVWDLQLLSECYLAFGEHKYAETSPFWCWFAYFSPGFVNTLLEYANVLIKELQDSAADGLWVARNSHW